MGKDIRVTRGSARTWVSLTTPIASPVGHLGQDASSGRTAGRGATSYPLAGGLTGYLRVQARHAPTPHTTALRGTAVPPRTLTVTAVTVALRQRGCQILGITVTWRPAASKLWQEWPGPHAFLTSPGLPMVGDPALVSGPFWTSPSAR